MLKTKDRRKCKEFALPATQVFDSKLFLKLIIIIFSQSRSALQLAQTELFRAQIEYSVGDMDTMMALSFGQMVSGHVQGPYGEPKFAEIMGYGSVGDERGLNL